MLKTNVGLGRSKIIFNPKKDVFMPFFPNLSEASGEEELCIPEEQGELCFTVCSGSLEWWIVKQGLGIVALGRAHDTLVLVYEIVKEMGASIGRWLGRRCQCFSCWSRTQGTLLSSSLAKTKAHKLFIWTRKKPSLTWLVDIKVCLVSQIRIKICRYMQHQSSFLGQCRFWNLRSLAFKTLLMSAKITCLPYFIIFELELSTFLGMLWLRI